MKKRITAMLLSMAMVLGPAAVAAGAEKTITVTPMTLNINGQDVTPTKSNGAQAEVFAYDGATYVPLRYLSELLGITVEWDKNDPTTAKLTGDITLPAGGDGTYTGVAAGFGGEVKAVITVVNGKLTACTLEGAGETPAIGGAALPKLQEQVLAAGSAGIDGVSGATVTSTAVKEAVTAALAQAKGATAADVKMKPGTYTGEAWGYNRVEKIKVSVTVSEDKLLAVDVDLGNTYETSTKLRNAAQLMAPRMVAAQSLGVDTITGATATSVGIRTAAAAAVEQALVEGTLSQLQAYEKPAAKEEAIDTDVVVVGMGGSGSYASLRVAQELYAKDPKNVKVLALDKAGNYGGTTALTSEAMSVNPPRIMAERNNGKKYVDEELFYQDWLSYTEGDAKPELIRLMMDRSGEALDWLDANGFDFLAPEGGLGDGSNDVTQFIVKYKFGPLDGGNISKDAFQACFDTLVKEYTDCGGKYLLETEATELLYEGDRVTGVKAYNKITNTTYTIRAKSVILATGGFAGSGEMTEKYLSDELYPLKGTWNLCGSMQNDGKMLQSAIDLGAGTYNMGMTPVCHLFGPDGWLTNYPNVSVEGAVTVLGNKPGVWSEGDLPMMLCFWPKTFAVNSEGKRFLPEDNLASFDAWKGGPDISVIVTQAQIQEIAQKGIDVDDSSMHLRINMDLLNNKIPIPRGTVLPNAVQVMEDGVKAGFISKADTIGELAAQLGLDPATLSDELAKYNAACKAGKDETLGKDKENLVAMESGPYYAIHAGMYCYGTCAGLDIDESFHVLKADGKTPISGLYAVGADGQGVIYSEKKAYVTYGGADNGWAIMSGYVCGEKVVEELP